MQPEGSPCGEERLPTSLIVGLVLTGFAMMNCLSKWLSGKATSATALGVLLMGMCLLMVSPWARTGERSQDASVRLDWTSLSVC